jgi:hypothetical protein
MTLFLSIENVNHKTIIFCSISIIMHFLKLLCQTMEYCLFWRAVNYFHETQKFITALARNHYCTLSWTKCIQATSLCCVALTFWNDDAITIALINIMLLGSVSTQQTHTNTEAGRLVTITLTNTQNVMETRVAKLY